MNRPLHLLGLALLLSMLSEAPRAQPPSSPPPTPASALLPQPAPPQAAASAPAAAASAAANGAQTIPRVEITGSADSDETLRRRQSIAMAVYGREELDRQGDIDVTDVLKRLPGVSMDAGAPRLRGLGGGYTQVLINGEPAPPGFSLDSLAPADVERIEIIKGATAEYAGVAGTINIVLREPPRTRQREWRVNLNYRAVQPGGSTALQWGDRIGGLSFVVPINAARSAQGSHYVQERLSRTPAGEIQSQSISGEDEGRSGSAQAAPRLQWKINDSDTLNLSGFLQRIESRNQGARQIATLLGTPWLTVADQSRSEGSSDVRRLQLQWQRRLPEGGKLELKSSWQDTSRESVSHYTAQRASNASSVERETRTRFGETRAALGGRWSESLDLAHTLVAGWDIETRQRDEQRRVWDFGTERLDSATGIPFGARIERTALFVQDEWAISDQWSMLPGLRMEQVKTRSTDSSSGIDNTARVTAPVLHLNYKLDPKGRDQVRASITRSFKLPELSTLVNRYVLNGNYERDLTNTPIAADRAGNQRLQPELSTGLDLAFEHYPAAGGVFSVGMFYRLIDDLIRQAISLENGSAPDITTVPRWVSRPVNLGRARSLGLELELKGRAEQWLPALFSADSGVQLRGSWSFYRSKVEQVEGPENRLEAQPPWLANMGFDARIKRSAWTVGASLVMQPGYTTQQTDRQTNRRSAVRTLDAFAAWKIDRSSQLRIGLVNLLAADTVSANSVADIDGFSAGSSMRRNTTRAINANWVQRF